MNAAQSSPCRTPEVNVMPTTSPRTPTLLSVVAPVYDEEELVEEFVARALRRRRRLSRSSWCSSTTAPPTARPSCSTGSPPPTRACGSSTCRATSATRPRSPPAWSTPPGDVVAMIDADLQDPPELILEMIERWSEGADVVYAVRSAARGRDRVQARHRLLVLQAVRQARPGRPRAQLRRLPPARPPRSGRAAVDDRALALSARHDRLGRASPRPRSPMSATRATPGRRSTRCARCCASRSTRSPRSRTCRCSWPPTPGLLSAGVAFIAIPVVIALHFAGSYLPGLRLDHDRDPAARRHPADRAGRDRRVRRAHLRRGQAPPAVHRARGAQPARGRTRRTGGRRDDGAPGTRRPARPSARASRVSLAPITADAVPVGACAYRPARTCTPEPGPHAAPVTMPHAAWSCMVVHGRVTILRSDPPPRSICPDRVL